MNLRLFIILLFIFSINSYSENLKEIELENEDQVYVVKDISPEKQKYQDSHFGYVYIAGEVKKNGALEWKDKMTLTDAIISSEYYVPLRANQKKIIIKRGSRNIYSVDAASIFNVRNPQENILLERGDTIIVQRTIPAIISDKLRILFLPIIDVFGNITSAIIQASSAR